MNKKLMLKIILLFSIVLLVLYLIFAICASITVNNVVKDAMNYKPFTHNNTTSEYVYNLLNPAKKNLEEGINIEILETTTPVIIPFTNMVRYEFTFKYADDTSDEPFCSTVAVVVATRPNIKKFNIYIYDIKLESIYP